jgi:hypothetical protein
LLHVARLLGIEPTRVTEIQIIFYTIWIIHSLARSEEDEAEFVHIAVSPMSQTIQAIEN